MTALVVDKKGLAKKLAHKPKVFIVHELLQNAWDEDGVTKVLLRMEMLAGRPVCRIFVEDDSPEGFQDLASVYTLFRDSKKAHDPTKRGRFELGEKLVAATALRMEVVTTKGGIVIEGDQRTQHRNKLQRGSAVLVDVRMTREEFAEVLADVQKLIPPSNIPTYLNGELLQVRRMCAAFTTTLPTIRSDEEGNLKPTSRKTEVRVYEPLPGETPSIYELGIPVMETGDQWHYDVCVAPNTRILTGDLLYVFASELVPGQRLLAFDEFPQPHHRKFRSSLVRSARMVKKPSYRLTFDDGTTIVCSGDHQWLTLKSRTVSWKTTEKMVPTKGGRLGSRVVRLLDVWEPATTYEAGYLSAAFDGEGCLYQDVSTNPSGVRNRLTFSQNKNFMLKEVERYLEKFGFILGNPRELEPEEYRYRGATEVHKVLRLQSRQGVLKFLGQIRPSRLLPKLDLDLLGSLPISGLMAPRLVRKEFLGFQQLVAVETSTHTFIAEGLASHNCQRVPINWERNSVPPSYLRTLRVEVLNAMHEELSEGASREGWVTEGLSDPRCSPDAAQDVKVKRFGEKSVILDPSDPEANSRAAGEGYNVIPGGSLPKGAWDNVRPFMPAAGQKFPTPKPYSEDGDPEKVIPPEEWTMDMKRMAVFAQELFHKLYGDSLYVKIVREPTLWWLANCGEDGCLTLNYGKLGKKWFASPVRSEAVLDLLIHEFAHYKVSDHLSSAYHRELTRLAAKLANLCLDEPVFFTT